LPGPAAPGYNRRLHNRRHFWTRLFWAAAIFVAIEGAIFRTGLYTRFLEPGSSTGLLQSYLRNEKIRPGDGSRQVLAVGDSRMGFRARAANELEPETGCTFATIAIPGSTPRCWYYMLREADPTASRYAAILIGVDNYDDEDYEDLSGREMDIRYVVPMLRWSDAWEFPASFPAWRNRWEALRATLFKGYAYRADFQDFLVRHKLRLRKVEDNERESANRRYLERWGDADLRGLRVDWTAWKVFPPPGSTQDQKNMLEAVLLRETTEQTGEHGRYLRQWYGRIVERYRGSRTLVVFLRLPRGPVVRPVGFVPKSAVVRELARRPEVRLVPEHAFDSLEKPEYFGDPMHLNEPGSVAFSRLAAREVRALLGP